MESVETLAARRADKVREREQAAQQIAELNERITTTQRTIDFAEATAEADGAAANTAKSQRDLIKFREQVAEKQEALVRIDRVLPLIDERIAEAKKQAAAELEAKLLPLVKAEQARIVAALKELANATSAESGLLSDLQKCGGSAQPVISGNELAALFGYLGTQPTDHPAFAAAGIRLTPDGNRLRFEKVS